MALKGARGSQKGGPTTDTKNLVFYEAKRPQGVWREGPRLQIRLEGCEHKGRTRWLLNTNILKMRTPLECQAHFGLKGPPAERQSRRNDVFCIVALKVARGSQKGEREHQGVF